MGPRIVLLAMFALVVFGGVETASANIIYSFTTIDVPGATSTQARGINDSGQIVGSSSLGGFLDTGDIFTAINVPGAQNTVAYGINDSGQIVGSFFDGTTDHGFLDTGGIFSTINIPGAFGTFAYGINDSDQIVGLAYFDRTRTSAIGWGGVPVKLDSPPPNTRSAGAVPGLLGRSHTPAVVSTWFLSSGMAIIPRLFNLLRVF